MRVNNPGGLASTLFLGLLPGAQALPNWLRLNGDHGLDLAPRDYSVNEPSVTNKGYSWYGYGPLPTLTSEAASSITQSNSGEETSASYSSYSRK